MKPTNPDKYCDLIWSTYWFMLFVKNAVAYNWPGFKNDCSNMVSRHP